MNKKLRFNPLGIFSFFSRKKEEEVEELEKELEDKPEPIPEGPHVMEKMVCAYCEEEILADHPKNRFHGKDFHKICWKQLRKAAKEYTG